MTPEAKELLKSIGKLIGYVATDFVDMVTCVPRDLLENHIEKQVQKKIIERQLPHLGKRPEKYQRWTEVTLGISEKEVGELLGLPDGIEGIAKDGIEYPGDPMLWCYARGRGARGGSVYFKNKKVVGFMFAGKDRLTCNFTNKGLDWGDCIVNKREPWGFIKHYGSAEALRRAVRIAYGKSFKVVVKSGLHSSSNVSHHLALFGAFGTFYSAFNVLTEYTEKLQSNAIRAELLLFYILMKTQLVKLWLSMSFIKNTQKMPEYLGSQILCKKAIKSPKKKTIYMMK